jgi:hypothetical protein
LSGAQLSALLFQLLFKGLALRDLVAPFFFVQRNCLVGNGLFHACDGLGKQRELFVGLYAFG